MKAAVDIRVIFGDTDQMGIVYYANYLRYFEASRGALLRDRGKSYHEVEAMGFALPVVEAYVRYQRPARYDDLIRVEVTVDRVRTASVRFVYQVTRDGDTLVEGHTLHACVGKDGKLARMPAELKRLLGFEAGV